MTTPIQFVPASRPAPPPGPLFRLVEAKLQNAMNDPDASLDQFISQRRATAPEPIPYRLIAQQLIALTGVDVTHEAVRRWYGRLEEQAA